MIENRKILVVDDDVVDYNAVKRLIKSKYQSIHSDGSNSITKQIETNSPVCVILDYYLGAKSGIDILKSIKNNSLTSHVPVIMLTGEKNHEVIVSCMQNGATDYICKDDLEKDKLLDKIQFVIDNAKLHQTIKNQHDRLTESEARYKFLAENTIIPVIIFNQSGEIVYSNDIAAITIGVKNTSELNGKLIFEFIHQNSLAKVGELIAEVFDGKSVQDELQFVGFNGKVLDVVIYAKQLLLNNENCIQVIINDITEIKNTNRKLLDSETRLKAISKATNEAILFIEDGVIIDANWAASSMSGYSYDELIGSNPMIFVSPEYSEDIGRVLVSEVNSHYDAIGLRKDGSVYNIEVQVRVIEYKGKQIRAIVIRDITERKKNEQKLIAAKEKATESDRLKSAFLATMSHELRTPLNAIIGFSDILDSTLTKDELIDFGKSINKSGHHLLNIVEDVFDIALIETGETKINKKHENLHSILDETHSVMKAECRRSNKMHLDLSLDIDDDNNELFITTDSVKLKQILINLLKNALKFTHAGKINFGYNIVKHNDETVVKFHVSDTGIGIPNSKQEFIFDAFRQVDESYTRKYGGVGIGLSICKKLVNLLGGNIWFDTSENKGSTFFFTLPYNPDIKAINKPKNANTTTTKADLFSSKKTILIVEDDDPSYEFLNMVLTKKGINTVWAKNGKEAVDKCNKNIDLVLMDINIPIMNGYDATKAIKKEFPNIPIIAQTAYAILNDRKKTIEAGCDDYISKPINQQTLISKLHQYLD